MIHDALIRNIIACAKNVHNSLGNGFERVIYERALQVEMRPRPFTFEHNKKMQIYYRDESIGEGMVDFLVNDLIIVYVKTIDRIEESFLEHTKNHLEAYNQEIALIFNFANQKLEYRYFYNKHFMRNIHRHTLNIKYS